MQFDIIGAKCLRPDGFDRERLSVSDGWFVDAPQHRRVDLDGYWVLPGIVDIHGDGFERHLAPRRGAVSDLAAGLVAVEAELAANGITKASVRLVKNAPANNAIAAIGVALGGCGTKRRKANTITIVIKILTWIRF